MSTKQCAPGFSRSLLIQIGRFSVFGSAKVDEFDANDPLGGQGLGLLPLQVELAANIDVKSQAGISALGDPYNCSIPTSLVGLYVGDQVRVTRNPNEYALYTVALKRMVDNPNKVRMGIKGRMRLGTSDEFPAKLRFPVPAPPSMTDAQAQAASEFVERLTDDGQNKGLVILAPHGGSIEPKTDVQAEAATAALNCSSWIGKGYRQGGGGYVRWHITSTKISPRSFPALGVIANRGFAYAVSFHGMSAGGVLIGGAGPLPLKMMLREAMLDALSDDSIAVTIARADDDNAGDSPKNVVNWMTEDGLHGIQIEQSMKVRQEHWQEIVDAVVAVYSLLI